MSFIGCYWGGGGVRVGLEVNGEKTEYVFMYIKHNAGPYESKRVGNGSFESVVQSKEHQTSTVQINTKSWRSLLPIGDTKFLSSRLLSDISRGNLTGFRRTAPLSTVLTANCTNKCTRFVTHTHSSQFWTPIAPPSSGRTCVVFSVAATSYIGVCCKRDSFACVGVTAIVR